MSDNEDLDGVVKIIKYSPRTPAGRVALVAELLQGPRWTCSHCNGSGVVRGEPLLTPEQAQQLLSGDGD